MKMMRILRNVVVAALALTLTLYAVYVFWGNFLTDEFYRQGLHDSGHYKVILSEFRTYFHEHPAYEAHDLEHLRDIGVVSGTSYDFIRENWYSYRPFTSETSNDAVVLRVGWPVFGQKFYKRDLVAHPRDPDVIRPKK